MSFLNKVCAASNTKSKYGHYKGPDLEAGKTSISGKEVAALKSYILPNLKEGDTILDYGAGTFARNADFLRGLGFKVYAYDPFNGTSGDGFGKGNVSTKLPTEKFDVGFTSFVLNVVNDSAENKIIKGLKRLTTKSYHIVRNDIVAELRKSINSASSRKILISFVKKNYPDRQLLKLLENNPEAITRDMVTDLAMFGYQTSKGFQKLPMLENKGFSLVKKASGWKLYSD